MRHPMLPLMLAGLALLPFSSSPGLAQDWGHARTVDIRLSSFRFTPETIQLRAGEPVILRLTNSSSGGHDFSAPEFFARASVAAGAASIEEGEIDVPSHRTVVVRLVPARGNYRLRCTHLLHSTFGMRGRIVVT